MCVFVYCVHSVSSISLENTNSIFTIKYNVKKEPFSTIKDNQDIISPEDEFLNVKLQVFMVPSHFLFYSYGKGQ